MLEFKQKLNKKEEILNELKEIDFNELGVLEDRHYKHNYNEILMSTDEIIK